MKLIRSMLGGLASALVATSAHAGRLEIVYWGSGYLQWAQIDGVSYTVEDDVVSIDNVPAGNYSLSFGANGQTRTVNLRLDGGNTAKPGEWCVVLELDSHQYLDEENCEYMWDDYYMGF